MQSRLIRALGLGEPSPRARGVACTPLRTAGRPLGTQGARSAAPGHRCAPLHFRVGPASSSAHVHLRSQCWIDLSRAVDNTVRFSLFLGVRHPHRRESIPGGRPTLHGLPPPPPPSHSPSFFHPLPLPYLALRARRATNTVKPSAAPRTPPNPTQLLTVRAQVVVALFFWLSYFISC